MGSDHIYPPLYHVSSSVENYEESEQKDENRQEPRPEVSSMCKQRKL